MTEERHLIEDAEKIVKRFIIVMGSNGFPINDGVFKKDGVDFMAKEILPFVKYIWQSGYDRGYERAFMKDKGLNG